MKRFLAIFLSITVGAAPMISSAATIQAPAQTELKTAKQWAAILGPKSLAAAASDCIDSVKSGGGSISVKLVDGTRLDKVANADGTGKKLLMFDATGALLQSVEIPAEKAADKAGVPNYVAREENYQAMKRFSKGAFLTAVRNQCRAMAAKRLAPGAGNGGDVVKAADYDADFDYFSDFDSDLDFFLDMANELINDDLAMADAAMSEVADRQAPQQKCTTVISQCRETCTTWGGWAITSCLVIGNAVSARFKFAKPAFTVGCAGAAGSWMEDCKSKCNTPQVECIP